ncbi:MAG TPA: N-acetyltransferase family protein [Sulfurospirillum arcachonense]|nr:N-acetyltransferase family protein [Sulfurospirillum arcachonense]HIP44345.1 N-acetyltransferase family protein [Sulfurospirillum arcachonense]
MIKAFRNATIEDLPQIVNIYNKAIEDGISTADSVKVTADEKIDWFIAHDKEKRPILVKEYHGKVIAWVSLQPFYPHLAYEKSARINIYIDSNFRGKKLGQMFLREVLEMADEYNIENFLALIFADNITSLKLFKKLGFKEWGHFPNVAKIKETRKDLLVLGLSVR